MKHTRFSYSEFVDASKNRVINPKNKIKANDTDHTSRCTRNGGEWYGTKNFDEAYEFATKGWDAGIKKLDASNKIEVAGSTNFVPSVVGSIVNIGNFVQGVPDNMYNIVTEIEYKTKPLTLYVPMNFAGSHDSNDALQRGVDIVKIINKLNVDYDLELIGIFNSYNNKGIEWFTEVEIKRFGENLVLNNVAFSFHPSFFRRITFGIRETYPSCDYGYGMSRNTKEIIRNLKKLKPNVSGMMIPSLQDMSSVTIDDLVKI